MDKGDSLRVIGRKLNDKGIIENEVVFEFFARLFELDREIQSGEYHISNSQSIREILAELSSGAVIRNKITIPEGKTSIQVVKILNELASLVGKITVLPPEGSIAPDTYFFSNGQSRAILLDQMQKAQKSILKRIWQKRSRNLSLKSSDELLILASIIEKETGKYSERAVISSVLHNRLKKGMRLQADPTVIYGITQGKKSLGRKLLRSDLKKFSKHNTYMINGLPETPICNPGKDSLLAAANPSETNFLFYVANGKGGHAFSQTLEQHNKNVRIWREIMKDLGAD